MTDVTNASRTMLMDLVTLDWDDELLGFFTVPRQMLPRIVPSSAPEPYGLTSQTARSAPICRSPARWATSTPPPSARSA